MGTQERFKGLGSVCELLHKLKKRAQVQLSSYLQPELISFFSVENREEAIESLVDLAFRQKKVSHKDQFLQAIIDREEIVSTSIGMGIAIPHAKFPEMEDFFILIGIQKEKGIEWDALDKAPVRLIFMIGGPDHKQTEYLHLLSQLTTALKNEPLRKKLISCENVKEVQKLFEEIE